MGEDTDSEVSINLVAGTVTELVLESEPASQLELTDYTDYTSCYHYSKQLPCFSL